MRTPRLLVAVVETPERAGELGYLDGGEPTSP